MNDTVDDFRPGIYRHYKHTEESPRYYQVLGVSRNTETDELYALYIPLYVIPEHAGVRYQVRPLGNVPRRRQMARKNNPPIHIRRPGTKMSRRISFGRQPSQFEKYGAC